MKIKDITSNHDTVYSTSSFPNTRNTRKCIPAEQMTNCSESKYIVWTETHTKQKSRTDERVILRLCGSKNDKKVQFGEGIAFVISVSLS